MKLRSCVSLAVLVAGAAMPSVAQTLVVGTCKSAKTHYTTIQAALNAAPVYANVLVCPGTYPEQLTITSPVTLTGISSGTLPNPIILGPAAGLNENYPNGSAMIAVVTHGNPGSVNVQGFTLNGSGCTKNGPGPGSAIRYVSSSGTISNLIITDPYLDCISIGIGVENDDTWAVNVTARNNVVTQIAEGTGIEAVSGPSSGKLNLQVLDNAVYGSINTALHLATNGKGVFASGNSLNAYGTGVDMSDASVVANNFINQHGEGAVGVYIHGSKGGSITGNTLTVSFSGIKISVDSDNVTVRSNNILGSLTDLSNIALGPAHQPGIGNSSLTSTLQSNTIGDFGIGVQSVCGATVIENTIFHAITGIDGAPAGQNNNYADVTTTQINPCP